MVNTTDTRSTCSKTVTLRRGARGYGFNLAEEYPCYMSAVHEGGVAWKAGLRTGDRLLALGSVDVTVTPHKDIVRMIANSGDSLRLTVIGPAGHEDVPQNGKRAELSSSSSSSDCDSDHEIWRKQKSDLAQKLQRECPRRSRYKNLITPIAETLLDSVQTGSLLRKRGRRYISANGQPVFEAYQGEAYAFGDHIGSGLPSGKTRPLSVLDQGDSVDRRSRNSAMKKEEEEGKKKPIATRSSSAPAYKRGAISIKGDTCHGQLEEDLSPSEKDDRRNDDWNEGSEDEDEDDDEEEEEDLIKKSVVVYIGAVPVPNAGASRKNILKTALQSLRAQRVRAHTVLLEIFTSQIVVTNSKGVMTNRFRADRIAYATSCAENKQYFGITIVMNSLVRQEGSSRLTTTTDETDESPIAALLDSEETDCSIGGTMVCHVFAVDPQLHLHSFHYHYARKFGIHCVRDRETNFCQEFPYSSNSILHAIGYIYRNHRTINRLSTDGKNPKSRPQNGAAYISSNSDSGIGNGKEDFKMSATAALRSNGLTLAAACSSSKTQSPKLKAMTGKQEMERSNSGGKKVVRFAEDNSLPTVGTENQTGHELMKNGVHHTRDLDTASVGSFTPSPLSQDPKDPPIVRQVQQSSHYVSTSATDVRQLLNSRKPSGDQHHHIRGGPFVPSVGHPLPVGSSGSAGEIRCNSPVSLAGSHDQLDTSNSSTSRQALKQTTGGVTRETCAGSATSLLSVSEAGTRHQQQQHGVSGDPKTTTTATTVSSGGTKHGSLLRDRLHRRLNRNAPAGEQLQITGGYTGRTSSVKMKQAQKERLEAWSTDFDRLLRDPAGLCAFSEFLRSQYCQENVNFWIACENYKLADDASRTEIAGELYRNYFASGCMEPVNVDSLAKQLIQEAVETENFTTTTFNPAQYQIFHLMKYDCYPRFLKSDEYQRCWEMSEKGQHMSEMKEPFLSNVDITGGSSLSLTSKTSCGMSEEQKKSSSSRKSILPWKNKFAGGVNIIGRHKGKKEEDTAIVSPQQPSTSASFGLATQSGLQDATGAANIAALSSVGSKRKQAWRHSKQLSTPAEVAHAVRKPSGSMEGLHLMYSKPSSALALTVSRPPDVVPQPDPPSSPLPGPNRRNASSKSVPPGSPLVSRPCTISDPDKFSCTLILPSRERIRVSVSEDLTVRRWLHELALQYGLNAAATDIIDMDTNEPVDLSMNASRALADKTVRLEGGVLFKVDLPCSTTPVTVGHASDASQRKLIAVKARAESAAGQVLRPILNKYGLLLDSMVVCVAGTNEVLPNHSPISSANNKKLMVLTQNEFEEWVHRDHDISLLGNRSSPSRSSLSPSFEDIIGAKYFQELPSHRGLGIAELPPELEGVKGARHHHQQSSSSNGSHKHVGGMLKFVKRGAAEATSAAATKILGQQTKSLKLPSHTQQHPTTATGSTAHQGATGKKSVLSKQELLDLAREEKRLAELLGRAQASSFDDQRGSTVKNFELPDFLKQPSSLAVPYSDPGAITSAVSSSNANAQSSSMDDSIITSTPSSSQRMVFAYSRPTDLVHRKLCGGSTPEKTALSSGSCEDDSERLDNGEGNEKGGELSSKCAVRINGEKSDGSKIPTHEEAEALFSGVNDADHSGTIDFNDPLMTERRRLSEFGLGTSGTMEGLLDETVKSGVLDECRTPEKSSLVITPRPPPPAYHGQRTNYCFGTGGTRSEEMRKSAKDDSDVGSSLRQQGHGEKEVKELACVLDEEKKRKGLYIHHQDDDWQVDYV